MEKPLHSIVEANDQWIKTFGNITPEFVKAQLDALASEVEVQAAETRRALAKVLKWEKLFAEGDVSIDPSVCIHIPDHTLECPLSKYENNPQQTS